MRWLLVVALAFILAGCGDTGTGDMPGQAYIVCVQHATDRGMTGAQARTACEGWR